MLRIQKFYRFHVEVLEMRADVLNKVIWEKEKGVLLKQCLARKTKQRQLLWKKLNLIEPNMKEAIIKAY